MTPRFAVCLLAALLAGCGAHNRPRDAIRAEMDAAMAAAASAPAAEAAPLTRSDEFFPSLRLDNSARVSKVLEPKFDLMVNDAPARQVFLGMVTDTRYSMLLPDDLDGRITVSLKEVTVPEALDALRQLYGYEYRIEGSRIFVQSRALQTRIMKVNYLNAIRKGNSDLRVVSGSVSDVQNTSSGSSSNSGNSSNNSTTTTHSILTSKVTTEASSDFWAELQNAVSMIVGKAEGRSVVASPQSGVLVVRATPRELSQVEAFLRASQLSLERQVMIEAKIVEVSLSDSFQAGINWAAFGGKRVSVGSLTAGSTISQTGAISTTPITSTATGVLGNAADAAGSMFGVVLRTANFAAVLNLLEQQGTVNVLSSPRVATINNQKAVLKVGSDDFFVTEVSTNSSTGTNGSSVVTPKLTLQPFFSGISLDVTPQIDEQDHITLHVHPMVSNVTSVTQEIDLGDLGKFKLPLASSQISEMDSVVRAQDGQMIALGGLIRQGSNRTDSNVPGAGSIPVFGYLFKQQSRETERRELVILLRPTVIQSSSDWSEDIAASRSRVDSLLDSRGTMHEGWK